MYLLHVAVDIVQYMYWSEDCLASIRYHNAKHRGDFVDKHRLYFDDMLTETE